MKKFLKISQEEKNLILEKYSLLKEIGETNECLEGDCKLVITDELRKNWKGCNASSNDPKYDFIGYGLNKERGYFTEIPELGFAKYKGEINGKSVTIEI